MQVALLSAMPPASASPAVPVPQRVDTNSSTTVSLSGSATSSGDGSQESASQPSAASIAEYMVSAAFSTTFKGKAYAGTVEQTNGVYTGVIANLPGAAATGSTIESVETNLGRMIDTLA